MRCSLVMLPFLPVLNLFAISEPTGINFKTLKKIYWLVRFAESDGHHGSIIWVDLDRSEKWAYVRNRALSSDLKDAIRKGAVDADTHPETHTLEKSS